MKEKAKKPLEMHEYIPSQKAKQDMWNFLNAQSDALLENKVLDKLPSSLFSYSSLKSWGKEGLECWKLKDLKKNQITLTNPNLFNDVYDSSTHRNSEPFLRKEAEQTKEMYDSLIRDSGLVGDIPSWDVEESTHIKNASSNDDFFMKYMSKDFRIKCFSETEKNILMWSHYGDNNNGICVEYDFSEHILKNCFFPVIYSNSPIDISEYANDTIPMDELDIDNRLSMVILLSTLIKFSDWRYEKEWRLVFSTILLPSLPDRMPIYVPKPKSIILGSAFEEYWKKIRCKDSLEVFKDFMCFVEKEKIPLKMVRAKRMSYELETIDLEPGFLANILKER